MNSFISAIHRNNNVKIRTFDQYKSCTDSCKYQSSSYICVCIWE